MPGPYTGVLVPNISRRTNFQCLWKATSPNDLGLVDDVDPSGVKLILDPIMTGSTGKKNKLGDRVVGFEGLIKIQLRQLNLNNYETLMPWAATAPYALTPLLNVDMYSFADQLTLHPVDMLTATTEDIIFTNAVPITLPLPKRTGGNDDLWEMTFAIYPNRTTMSTTPLVISPGNLKGT
jgi:hypothetical protein